MIVEPWTGDACSLVDAYRDGVVSPLEVTEAALKAIADSELNAFSLVDDQRALDAAVNADISLPFGGVPMGIKELEAVEGWPDTEASLVFADRVYEFDSTQVTRLRAAGAILVAQTTSPEFGGINATYSRIHGVTRNPWNPERTPGGSSGGTAAAVAGGILPIASGSDGGGSIRIPSGFSGLFGLKATYGRIPRGPRVRHEPLTVTVGCLSRSVRDTARWLDVCSGPDSRDTLSLARVDGWETGLGTHNLEGKRAVIAIDLGSAVVEERMTGYLIELCELLIETAKLRRVDVAVKFPSSGWTWAISNNVGTKATLGDLYPDCAEDLTREIKGSMKMAVERYSLEVAAAAENFRIDMNEAMANVFDEADFIFAATNPDVAFAAEGPMPTTVGDVDLRETLGMGKAISNNGALTIPANLTGNPAISVPAGTIGGLPFGLQIIGRHHEEPLLLDLALVAERENPWPLTAPPSKTP